MKKGNAFWGAFFILFGALNFIDNFYKFSNINWISDFWPLILILIGLVFIVPSNIMKFVLSLIAGALTALVLYAQLNQKIIKFDFFEDNQDEEYESGVLSIPRDENLTAAKLEIDAFLGNYELSETSDYSIKIESDNQEPNFAISESEENGIKKFTIKNKFFKPGKIENIYHKITLDKNVNWDINISSKAGKTKLNFLNLKTSSIKANLTASDVEIIFPNNTGKCDSKLEIAASQVKIFFPRKSGVQVKASKFASSFELFGFEKKANNLYQTENFETAASKIYVDLSAVASSVEINFY